MRIPACACDLTQTHGGDRFNERTGLCCGQRSDLDWLHTSAKTELEYCRQWAGAIDEQGERRGHVGHEEWSSGLSERPAYAVGDRRSSAVDAECVRSRPSLVDDENVVGTDASHDKQRAASEDGERSLSQHHVHDEGHDGERQGYLSDGEYREQQVVVKVEPHCDARGRHAWTR